MNAEAPTAPASPILILGLGNPILGDDGVGWRVAEAVQDELTQLNFNSQLYEIDFLSVGGLSLMERMVGYDCAILIDAILTGQAEAGTVSRHSLDELPNRALGHLTSSHDTTLHNALAVGRKMGAHLPESILVVSIEAGSVFEFSEDLTPPIAKAVSIAANQVIKLLDPAGWTGKNLIQEKEQLL